MNLIIMKFLKINKIARYNPCKKKKIITAEHKALPIILTKFPI